MIRIGSKMVWEQRQSQDSQPTKRDRECPKGRAKITHRGCERQLSASRLCSTAEVNWPAIGSLYSARPSPIAISLTAALDRFDT